jgi:hypothetical protein
MASTPPQTRLFLFLLLFFINGSHCILSHVRGLERSGTNMIQGFFEQCKVDIEGECVDLMPDGKSMFKGSDYMSEKGINPELAFPRPDQDRPCWKHFRNRAVHSLTTLDKMAGGNRYPNDEMVYFVTLKNPYAWIPSYCLFHLRCHMDNMTTVVGLVHEWNDYMAKWLYLKEKHPNRVMLVRYEQILTNAADEFAPLLTYLHNNGDLKNGYECIQSGVNDLVATGRFNGKTMNVMMSHGKRWDERKRYYLNCEYFDKLTYEQIKAIDKHLSPHVLKGIGYDLEPCVLKAKHIILTNTSSSSIIAPPTTDQYPAKKGESLR